MRNVYLITAIHFDGSRRQWAGKIELSTHQTAIDCMRVEAPICDQHWQPGTRYETIPIELLPDCAIKHKNLIQ
jgi:hypothetical protein